MVANLGYGTLIITFIVSLYGAGAAFYGARSNKSGWVDSARNAMLAYLSTPHHHGSRHTLFISHRSF